MGQLALYLRSSIGKKTLMGLTGLAWSGFVMTHMLANLLIIFSPEAYNKYSHALITNPFIYLAEAGLVLTLLAHAFTGMKLAAENKSARPEGYAVKPSGEKAASVASSTMIYTGSLLLAFVVYHLITFKFGPYYTVTYDGVEMRDLYRLVIEVFQSPLYVFGYVICMFLVGLHLSHGFQSSFQSLGFRHPKYTPAIKVFGTIYSVIVAAGFIVQPLYVFFIYKAPN